ncbi:MAG: ATP-binding protein [Cyanobacteria bacterium SBLK]|nr:ATP-binding protein [Cyanobacteria bacterium SBLK]
MIAISEETITIEGDLGEIQALEPLKIDIAPLTVFIGAQGTGKSLISQFLYFFRDSEYLLTKNYEQKTPEASVRNIINDIRSGQREGRSLTSFINSDTVSISYSQKSKNEQIKKQRIGLYKKGDKINPLEPFKREIDKIFKEIVVDLSVLGNIQQKALFIPAERILISHFINSKISTLVSPELPLTMREFATVLSNKITNNHILWNDQKNQKSEDVKKIDDFVSNSLGGKAIAEQEGASYGRKWKWSIDGKKSVEMEMLSSGQMGTWPLIATAQALLSWDEKQRPVFIHIEEPEIHLHPSAQIAIIKTLAYLVNHGFRIIITTHSLFLLYAINNLILAYQQLEPKEIKNFPEVEVRLNPDDVSAYCFGEGTITKIIDDSGQIDDSLLGRVLGNLEKAIA